MGAVLKLVRAPQADYEGTRRSDEAQLFYGAKRKIPDSVSDRARALHMRGRANADMMKRGEQNLLDDLREMDDSKSYCEFDCRNLYEYAVDWLGLTESVALNLIAIMRRAKQVPELKVAIKDGRINMSAARKIAPVINRANQEAWLELASSASVREIEKAVAIASPKHAVQESIRYATGERLELKLGISEEFRDTLQELKDLLSQKQQKPVDSEDALFFAMRDVISRLSPLERAKRAEMRKQKQAASGAKSNAAEQSVSAVNANQSNNLENKSRSEIKAQTPLQDLTRSQTLNHNLTQTTFPRQPLSALTKHTVNLRDRNRCTERNNKGDRCTETRWLDVHHVTEVASGGDNSVENLRTVCRWHHRKIHKSHVT